MEQSLGKREPDIFNTIRNLEHIVEIIPLIENFLQDENVDRQQMSYFKRTMALCENNLTKFLNFLEPSEKLTSRVYLLNYLKSMPDYSDVGEDFTAKILLDNIPSVSIMKKFVIFLENSDSDDFVLLTEQFVNENVDIIVKNKRGESREMPYLFINNPSETFTKLVTEGKVYPKPQRVILETEDGEVKPQKPFGLQPVTDMSECEKLLRTAPWIKTVKEIYISPLNKESEEFVIFDVKFDLNGEKIWNRPNNKKFFKLLCDSMNIARQNGKNLEIGDKYKFRILFLLTNGNLLEQDESVFAQQKNYMKLLSSSGFGKIQQILEQEISIESRRIFLEELQTIIQDRPETIKIENKIYNSTNPKNIKTYYENASNILAYLYFGDEQTLFHKRLNKGFYKGKIFELTVQDKADSSDVNLLRYYEKSKTFVINRLGNMLYSQLYPTEKVIKISSINMTPASMIAFNEIPKNYEEISFNGTIYDVKTLYKDFKENNIDKFSPDFVRRVLLMNIPEEKEDEVRLEKPVDAKENIFDIFYYIDKNIEMMRNTIINYQARLDKTKICEYCKKFILVDEYKSLKLDDNTPKMVAYCSQACLEEGEFQEEDIPTDTILANIDILKTKLSVISKGMKGSIMNLGKITILEIVKGDNVKGEGDKKHVLRGNVTLKIKLDRKARVAKDFPITLYDNGGFMIATGKSISESEEE